MKYFLFYLALALMIVTIVNGHTSTWQSATYWGLTAVYWACVGDGDKRG